MVDMNDARDNKATETQAYEALRLAQIHAHKGQMASSARSCAVDAEAFFNKGMFGYAHEWARQSLRYSVGVFHDDFAKLGGGL